MHVKGPRYALQMQKLDESLVLLNLDAANAYNSIDRMKQYQLIVDEIPELQRYYEMLYKDGIPIHFAVDHVLQMTQGNIQGLLSSQVFYSMAKYRIQQTVKRKVEEVYDQFQIIMKTDYIDDGLTLMHYKFVSEYIRSLTEE